MTIPHDEEIAHILAKSCTIAVVGCSHDRSRPSRRIAEYLKEHGYRVLPVNPNYAGELVLGEIVRPSLLEIDEPIDIVNVFRKPEFILPIVEDALLITAPVFWMQLGIDDPVARARLLAAGRRVIADRCIQVEHERLITAA